MRRFTLMTLFLLISAMTFAGLKLGIKAGYNANKLTANIDSVSSQFKSGMQLGIFLRAGKRFYVQPELYYSLQGAEYILNDPTNTRSWNQKVTIGSIDIPVLLGFKIINGEKINFRVNLGPEVSFVTNRQVKDLNDLVPGPITGSSINPVNWYIQAGLGVDLWFFTIDLRYLGGLNEVISSVQSGLQTWDFSSKNNVFQFSLGFKIL
ncbi:MAG: porin family protein [Bacteroidetes bacterium]|nr:porin family protein [Bacteroidota bacterium]